MYLMGIEKDPNKANLKKGKRKKESTIKKQQE